MDQKYWNAPVHIDLRGAHNQWSITACSHALNCLERQWPSRPGPKYWAALKACHQALADKMSSDRARDAFVEAAQEADVLDTGEPHGEAETYGADGRAGRSTPLQLGS